MFKEPVKISHHTGQRIERTRRGFVGISQEHRAVLRNKELCYVLCLTLSSEHPGRMRAGNGQTDHFSDSVSTRNRIRVVPIYSANISHSNGTGTFNIVLFCGAKNNPSSAFLICTTRVIFRSSIVCSYLFWTILLASKWKVLFYNFVCGG